MTDDRRQMIDDNILLHKELYGSLKYEILISKSETNSKYKCSNAPKEVFWRVSADTKTCGSPLYLRLLAVYVRLLANMWVF